MATIADLREVARTIDSPDDAPSSLICRAAHATRDHIASAPVEASLRALGWRDVDVRECVAALGKPSPAIDTDAPIPYRLAVLGHCVGEPGVSCCACGHHAAAESRLEAERWTEDGEGDWMCPACRGGPDLSVRRLDHTRDGEEHRFVLSGVVECRTRDWGIARVFAEALLRLAGEEES